MDTLLNKDTGTITIVVDEPLNALHLKELQDEVDSLTLGFGTKLIFDCAGMDYICSSGLRIFLGMQKKASAAGTELKILHLQPNVKNVFDMTGFSSLFSIEE